MISQETSVQEPPRPSGQPPGGMTPHDGCSGSVGHAARRRARAAYGQPERVRTAAITSLGKLGKKTPSAVLPTLLAFAQNDPYFRARSTAVGAIGRLGQRSALEPLAKIEATDTEVSVTNAAYDAIAEINDALAKKPGHP